MAALIVQRPSPESDTRPENFSRSGIFARALAVRSSSHEAIDAATPPDLRDVRQVEVVLVVLGVAQWRRLGVDRAVAFADVGVPQDADALGVGRHEAVLDAVVHHLHEVASAVRAAVQIALLRQCRRSPRDRGSRGRCRDPGPSGGKSGRGEPRPPARRRSSCSSPARVPTRRRSCRRPRNGFPSQRTPSPDGCRPRSRSCRRR